MDITTVFGTVIGGSNPSGSTKVRGTFVLGAARRREPGSAKFSAENYRDHKENEGCVLSLNTNQVREEGKAFPALRHSNTKDPYRGLSCCSFLVRVGRIELPSAPWQGAVLPLNHTRNQA